MANLKPNEVRISHPKAERPLVVLRTAFEAGRYPGWVEDRVEAPKRKRKTTPVDAAPDEAAPDGSDTEATATDNEET